MSPPPTWANRYHSDPFGLPSNLSPARRTHQVTANIMNDQTRALIAIARMALDAANLELNPIVLPPPASETVPPEPARKLRRKRRRFRKPWENVKPVRTSHTDMNPKRGRPKGALDYICLSCKHGFRAVHPVHCPNPECGAQDNFVLKKEYNREEIPAG